MGFNSRFKELTDWYCNVRTACFRHIQSESWNII